MATTVIKDKTKTKADPKVTKREVDVTETLKCALTDEEIRAASEALARNIDELATLEKEKKTLTDNIKAKMTEVESQITLNTSKVRDKYEYRKVNCKKVFDYKNNTVSIVRTDTGSVESKRDMFVEERQQQFEFEKNEE